jgi:peptidoglycan/xylan/chitin deacetylase (PgdA/CDA1 family)
LIRRIANGWRRYTIERFARRDIRLRGDVPYVSFTFDDFPRSAWAEGGRILRRYGVHGTYFVSFQLLGGDSPSGPIASLDDVREVVADGHELGCHTFGHLDGSVVSAAEFEQSIEDNHRALVESGLDAAFDVFAYPLNGPRIRSKGVAGAHFTGCRFGGQTFNVGLTDLNLLKAFFIDARSRADMASIARLIAANADSRGWLIFATHDVEARPSNYGCAPETLDRIVQLSLASGATLLPMSRVCRAQGLGC